MPQLPKKEKKRKPDKPVYKMSSSSHSGMEFKFSKDTIYGRIIFNNSGGASLYISGGFSSMFNAFSSDEIDTTIRIMRDMVDIYDAYALLHPKEKS